MDLKTYLPSTINHNLINDYIMISKKTCKQNKNLVNEQFKEFISLFFIFKYSRSEYDTYHKHFYDKYLMLKSLDKSWKLRLFTSNEYLNIKKMKYKKSIFKTVKKFSKSKYYEKFFFLVLIYQ